MLNEEKVKTMNRLALYEKNEGKKYLPVSKFYRSDFIGLALIRNFFLVTIGYVLIIAMIALYYGEYLLDHIYETSLTQLGEYAVTGYVAALIGYTVLTYLVYAVKYYRAKKSVRGYYQELTKLEKIYSREEKRSAARRNGRRI